MPFLGTAEKTNRTLMLMPGDVLQRITLSRYAPCLTHGCLAVLLALEFFLILRVPFWVMLLPGILVHHRIGILLHEYMHGIPLRRYKQNLWVFSIANSLILTFGLNEVFRGTHLEHHRWLNTDKDPGYWPNQEGGPDKVYLRPFWLLYRSLCGDHGISLYVKHLWGTRNGVHRYVLLKRVALEAILSAVVALFWIAFGLFRVPLTLMLLHLCVWPPGAFRGALEHSSRPGDPNFANEYRVHIPLFNMNRHIHHHIDPTCPWYLLEFKSPDPGSSPIETPSTPLPPSVYWTHWYHVFVKRDYGFMQPMPPPSALRPRAHSEA